MKNRLKKVVNYLKLENIIKSQEDLARQINYDKASVSQALNGSEKYLTDSFIAKFCRKFNIINEDWLLTGEGEMLKQNNIGHTTVGDYSPINGNINVNECRVELEKAMLKISYLEERLKEKDAQIAELKVLFEQRLKDKEEIITLLKK